MKSSPNDQPLRLSILENGSCFSSKSSSEVLRETIELAQQAEALGYHRFWLTEHPRDGQAWASPELVLAALGQATKRIRLGTGCILLQLYSPFKVACNFRLLESLYPGRIDAGVGCGVVTGPVADAFFDGGKAPPAENRFTSYISKVEELSGFLSAGFPVGHPYHGVRSFPSDAGTPELWLLGGVRLNMSLASRLTANYCHEIFLKKPDSVDIVESYKRLRELVSSSAPALRPRTALAVAGICAETEEKAIRIRDANPQDYIVPLVVGAPEQCARKLREFQSAFSVDEIIFRDVSADFQDKLLCYRLLADSFNQKCFVSDERMPTIQSEREHT
jgi:luciferase family oxidoreductase group 1